MRTTAVHVAPGSGRVIRRPSVLLFDPTGTNAELIEAFDYAATDEEAQVAVKRHLIDAEFELGPLALVSWANGALDLLVFGDVSLHSSIAAAPMITGAGSATWVERHLSTFELGDATNAEVWTGDDTDDITDLRLGIVPASGVKVDVVLTEATSAPAANEPPADDAQQAAAVASDEAVQDADSAESEAADGEAERVQSDAAGSDAASPDDVSAEESVAAKAAAARAALDSALDESVAPTVPADIPTVAADPADSIAAEVAEPEAAAHVAPAETAPAAVAEPDPYFAPPEAPVAPAANGVDADAEHTAPPAPAPAAVAGDSFEDPPTQPASEDDDLFGMSNVGLVEAMVCPSGHANPPLSTICSTCNVAIPPTTEPTLIDQPTVGQLTFLDGQSVPIDQGVVIGRKPDADDQSITVAIEQAEVSRSHAKIAVEGWTALLTDLGSRNGTYVVTPENPTPVRLDEGVQHYLEDGTTVHLGGPEASFVFKSARAVATA